MNQHKLINALNDSKYWHKIHNLAFANINNNQVLEIHIHKTFFVVTLGKCFSVHADDCEFMHGNMSELVLQKTYSKDGFKHSVAYIQV